MTRDTELPLSVMLLQLYCRPWVELGGTHDPGDSPADLGVSSAACCRFGAHRSSKQSVTGHGVLCVVR